MGYKKMWRHCKINHEQIKQFPNPKKLKPPCNFLIRSGKMENYHFNQILLGSNQSRYLTVVSRTPLQNKQDRWTHILVSNHIRYEAQSQSQLIDYPRANRLPNGALSYTGNSSYPSGLKTRIVRFCA